MIEPAQFLMRVVRPGDGVAFANMDELLRLHELGLECLLKDGITTKETLQTTLLENWPAIRDLEHYRELVGNPRTEGPGHWVGFGETVLLERAPSPLSGVAKLVLMDTAIGNDESWLRDLAAAGVISLEEVSEAL